MFTRTTKYFGIWREHHPSRTRYAGNPTQSFVFSLAVATFVSSMVFFLVIKIRGEFFLLDSLNLNFNTITAAKSDAAFRDYQASTLSVAMSMNKENPESTVLVFDNGESFEFPSERGKMTKAVLKRLDFLELFSMLNLTSPVGTGTLQLLPDSSVSWYRVREIISFFGALGFDNVDVAFRLLEKKS